MTTTNLNPTRIAFGKLWWTGLIIAGTSAIVNAILFFIGAAVGAFPENFIIPSAGSALTIAPVLLITVVAALLATAVFAMIGRFSRSPFKLFTIIAVIVLVLSFASPFSVPNAPTAFYIFLELMHLTEGAICIGLLNFLPRR